MPTVEQDKIISDVWSAASKGRPQELMRAIIRAGLRAQMESGDLPLDIVKACRLEDRLGIKHGSGGVSPAAPAVMPYVFPAYMPPIYSQAPEARTEAPNGQGVTVPTTSDAIPPERAAAPQNELGPVEVPLAKHVKPEARTVPSSPDSKNPSDRPSRQDILGLMSGGAKV